ncbi:MAG: hypothetical protein JXA60_10095 [Candidatus Coatesbacteria bacterium]|nr:hypothetical protein [Candidatus Coatesbacteria bacterium]
MAIKLKYLLIFFLVLPAILFADMEYFNWYGSFFNYRPKLVDMESKIDDYERNNRKLEEMSWLEYEALPVQIKWTILPEFNTITISLEDKQLKFPYGLVRLEKLDYYLQRSFEIEYEKTITEVQVAELLATKEKENQGLIPEIELPSFGPEWWNRAFGKGGKLDVSGHQRLAVGAGKYKTDAPPDEYGSNETTQVGMKQELKVLAKGTIGTKLSVLLDYDSTRNELEGKNKVQIEYKGEEDEIIQEISAGDIELGITGPEFLSYNIPHKGLFGARARFKVGGWEFITVASLEEGQRQRKEFSGQTQVDSLQINDLDWLKNQYYFISSDSLGNKSPVDSVYLYVSTLDSTGNDAGFGQAFLDPSESNPDTTNPNHWRRGYWKLLYRGSSQDFIVYADTAGLIYLNTPIERDKCLAAVYIDKRTQRWIGDKTDFQNLRLKIIKPTNSSPPSKEGLDNKTWEYQHMGIYSLNAINLDPTAVTLTIGYDNKQSTQYEYTQGKGSSAKTFLQILGMADENGKLKSNLIDTQRGHIFFPSQIVTRDGRTSYKFMPFIADTLNNINETAYFKKDPLPNDRKYILFTTSKGSSSTYSLGQTSILEGSELVYVNDTLLKKDKDYSINYAAGIVTIFKPPGPNDKVKILFEFATFLAQSSKTLLGFRTIYNFFDESLIGTTWMYENTQTIEDKPEVGSEPQKITAGDVDLALKFKPEFLTEWIDNLPFIKTNKQSEFNLTAEIARNFPNPNTKIFGYIDDMENVNNSYPLGIRREGWYSGSQDSIADPQDTLRRGNLVYWNVSKLKKYVFDNITGTKVGDESVDLLFLYMEPRNFSETEDSWTSLMKCLDSGGVDFSEKRYLVLWLKADHNEGYISIDLGGYMNEDANNDGILNDERLWRSDSKRNPTWNVDTDDVGIDMTPDSLETGPYSPPDRNRDNYWFKGDEDAKNDPENPDKYRGINGTENNRHHDTEDLDANGSLDRQNHFYSYTIRIGQSLYKAGTNKAGYMLYKIPLHTGYTRKFGSPDLAYLRYARMRVYGQKTKTKISIAALEVEGSTWLNDNVSTADSTNSVKPDEKFEVTVKNTRDNEDYRKDPPPGVDPGIDENGDVKQEQSLCLNIENIRPGHYAQTHKALPAAMNILNYRKFAFWIHGKDDKTTIWMRVGADSLNYYEYRCKTIIGWKRAEFLLKEWTDLKDAIPDSIKKDRTIVFTRGPYSIKGLPNLNNITWMAIGLENNTRVMIDSEVWIDEIHLRDVIVKSGYAKRITLDNKWADFMEIKGDVREIDGHFYSLGESKPSEKDQRSYTGSMTLNLDKFFNQNWRLQLPATYSLSLKRDIPFYKTGTDIELEEMERDKEKTTYRENAFSFKAGKQGPSKTFYENYILNNLSGEFAYSYNRERGPVLADTLETYDYRLKYAFNRQIDKYLDLKWLNFHYIPTKFNLGGSLSHKFGHSYDIAEENESYLRDRTMEMKITEEFGLETQFFKNLTTAYGINIYRDRNYKQEFAGVNIGPEVGREQVVNGSYQLSILQVMQPGISYTTTFREDHRPELRQEQADTTKDIRNVDNTNTLRLDNSFALSRFFYMLGGSKEGKSIDMDEFDDLDDTTSTKKNEIEAGSPKWIALQLGALSKPIMPLRGNITITKKTEVYDLLNRPNLKYQMGWGIEDLPDEGEIRRRDKEITYGLGSGLQPIPSIQFTTDYEYRVTKSHYLDNPEGSKQRIWPKLALVINDVHNMLGIKKMFEEVTVGSSYSTSWDIVGELDKNEEIIPNKETNGWHMEPRFKITFQFPFRLQVSVEDSYSKTQEKAFSGSFPITDSKTHKDAVALTYAFNKPNGFYLPIIPFVYKIRLRLKTDLVMGLEFARETNFSIQNDTSEPITDKLKYSIKPSLAYNFQVITAALQAEYGVEDDRAIANGRKTINDAILWIMFYF